MQTQVCDQRHCTGVSVIVLVPSAVYIGAFRSSPVLYGLYGSREV